MGRNSEKDHNITGAMSSKFFLVIEFLFAYEIFHKKKGSPGFFCLNESHLLLENFLGFFKSFILELNSATWTRQTGS